jgi:hypothetical protein
VIGFDDDTDERPASLSGPATLQNIDSYAMSVSRAFDGSPTKYEAGTFWLVKTARIYIQGDFRSSDAFAQGGAVVAAVAIGGPFLGGDVLIVRVRDDDVTWNGGRVALGEVELGGVLISNGDTRYGQGKPHTRFEATLPLGTRLMINRYAKYINVRIMVPDSIGAVDGTCGGASDHGFEVLVDESLFATN